MSDATKPDWSEPAGALPSVRREATAFLPDA